MGSKFFINYLRQKWCQMPKLFVTVALYWVCGYTQYSCGLAESHKVRVRAGVGFTFYAIPTIPNATVYVTTLP